MVVLSKYHNSQTRVLCKCKVCAFEWNALPYNLLSGYGCPQCGILASSQKQQKSNDEFIEQLRANNPTVSVLSKYSGNKNKVLCLCNKCGNEWLAMPINLLRDKNGTGCPACKRSHGEAYIANVLLSKGIRYEEQYCIDGLIGVGGRKLPFDFYLPEYNALIEYQGRFHDNTDRLQSKDDFAIRKEHDKRKSEYAVSHGYKFYQIWYYDDIDQEISKIIA